MAFLSIIRRWHKRDQVPIREISRRTGVSRNTVRKYLRSDVIEPKFQVPDRPSKLDPYAEKLSAWLRREQGGRASNGGRSSSCVRSRQPRLRRILQPCGGVCPGLEGGMSSAAGRGPQRYTPTSATANSAKTTHTSPASPTSATSDSAAPSARPVCRRIMTAMAAMPVRAMTAPGVRVPVDRER
jgi:hypothetical protein